MNKKSVLFIIIIIIVTNVCLSLYLINRVYQLNTQVSMMKGKLAESNREVLLYESLKEDFNSLKNDFDSLELIYRLKTELRISNGLKSFYDTVRLQYGYTGTKGTWVTEKEKLKFAVRLILHDLRNSVWPSIENVYHLKFYRQSYVVAWEKLQIAYSVLELQEEDKTLRKVDKILRFVNDYIKNENEINDIFRSPVETLSMGSGDIDDFSILVAALFETADIESAIGSFIDQSNEKNFLVLIHLENFNNESFFVYDDLTQYGLSKGKWIIVNPQKTIENQKVKSWFAQLSLIYVVEIKSDLVDTDLI